MTCSINKYNFISIDVNETKVLFTFASLIAKGSRPLAPCGQGVSLLETETCPAFSGILPGF